MVYAHLERLVVRTPPSLSVGGLEHHPALLRGLGEGHAQLEELEDDGREIVEEGLLVLGVPLDVRLERLVGHERHVGGQHHERLGRLVLILFARSATTSRHSQPLRRAYLLGTVPLPPVPLLVQEQLVVLVGHDGRREGPRTIEAAAVGVAASEGVGAAQCDDLLVVEAHAIEDVAQVPVALAGVGEASVGCAGGHVLVSAAWSEWDGRALHLLDSHDTAEDPEVRGGDPGELCYVGVSSCYYSW